MLVRRFGTFIVFRRQLKERKYRRYIFANIASKFAILMVLYQSGESVIEVVRYMEISVPGASWRRGVDRWSETVGGDVAEGQDETTAPIFTMDRSLRARRVTAGRHSSLSHWASTAGDGGPASTITQRFLAVSLSLDRRRRFTPQHTARRSVTAWRRYEVTRRRARLVLGWVTVFRLLSHLFIYLFNNKSKII